MLPQMGAVGTPVVGEDKPSNHTMNGLYKGIVSDNQDTLTINVSGNNTALFKDTNESDNFSHECGP